MNEGKKGLYLGVAFLGALLLVGLNRDAVARAIDSLYGNRLWVESDQRGSGPGNFTLGTNDAYIKGKLEVDGAVYFDGAVTIPDSTIVTAKIALAAVTTPKLSPDAVTTPKLLDGAVTTNKLSPDAVVTSKIIDGAVLENKLGASSVVTAKIQAGAITTSKLYLDLGPKIACITTSKAVGTCSNVDPATGGCNCL